MKTKKTKIWSLLKSFKLFQHYSILDITEAHIEVVGSVVFADFGLYYLESITS